MSEVRIRLFGGPEVTSVEGSVELTPHQACLLTLVAAHREAGIPRTRVIRTFWGEPDTPRARHRLRQLLHDLRGRMGGGVLGPPEADPLHLDGASSDLEEWERLVADGALTEAARLTALGFGSRLETVPHREFRDWLDGRELALRRHLEERAASLWDRSRAAGRWEEGRDAAEALFLLAPADEGRLRRVVEARAMTGAFQAVEAAVTTSRAHRPEGARLEPATVELLERVRALEGEGGRFVRGRERPPAPLVGRIDLLAELETCLGRIQSGQVELALLTGEGGIGKTRILMEIGQRARLKGLRVLAASPVEVEQRLPLGALSDALSGEEVREHVTRLSEPWRTLVAAFLPAHAGIPTLPEVPPVQESALSRRLLDAFSFLLASLAEERPTLLLLDDLQWADDTTLAILQSVTRRWERGTFGIIGTARPPRELGRRWPSPYLNQLVSLATVRREVDGLSSADSRRLIHLTAGRPLDAEGEERLIALGGSNPFFIIELTKDHLAGRLPLARAPDEPLPLPISLQELFEHRLDTLSEPARTTAEVLAIRARSMPMTELAALTGHSLEAAAQTTDELLRRRLAKVEDGRVSISHELFRSAFYQQVTPARLAVRHLQVARHLEGQEGPTPHAELAVHFSRGGEAVRAAHHGRLAAELAVESGAIAEATHLLRIVVENEPDPMRNAESMAELARLLHVSRDMERAAPLLASAAEQLRLVGRRTQALRLDIRQVESRVEATGIPVAEAVERLARIKEEARREADWVAVAMALDTEMHLLHQVGDVQAIRSMFDQIRSCAASGDREAECLANASLAMSILFGDPEEGLTAARRAVQIAEEDELGQHLLRAQTRLMLVRVYRGESHVEPGLSLLTKAREGAARTGNLGLKFYLESSVGVGALDAGNFVLAEDAFERSQTILKSVGYDTTRMNLLYNRGELALMSGEPEVALRYFEESEDVLGGRLFGEMPLLLTAGIGLCHLRLGHLRQAREREEQMPESPHPGSFDPTIVLAFRSQLLRHRKAPRDAVDLLEAAQQRLVDRLPVAWLKSRIILLENGIAAGLREDLRQAGEEALELAVKLKMPTHIRRIERLLAGNRW